MTQEITIEKFCESNVAAYESLTRHGDDGNLCYCSFWHQKWSSMGEYKKIQKENPDRLRSCVLDRMKSNFHVGVIAYEKGRPCAWVSVGPLTDFFWAWRRVAQVGENAKTTAAILCFTAAPEFRGTGIQTRVLKALKVYGQKIGWTAIEAYPFSDEAIEKHGASVKWAGFRKAYEAAGFEIAGEHWLSTADTKRHLLKLDLN